MSRLSKLIATALLTVLVAGCSGSPKANDTVPASGGEPVQGGVLVRAANYGDPGNLDPIAKSDIAAQMIVMQIFDRLLQFDAAENQFKKTIAEDYSIGPDGLVYNFKLHKGITFHNGRELKAEDVKYSYERAVNPNSISIAVNAFDAVVGAEAYKSGAANEISGIKVLGEYELEITLKEVNPNFLLTVAGNTASIVPKEEVERLGDDFGQKPIGSGPFKFKDWKKDDMVELEVHDKYHLGRPYLDGVVYRFMSEEQTRDAEFLAGSIDMMVIGEVLYQKYSNDADRSKQLVEVPELFTRAIHFNTSKPPFNDVRVRQAINYAIDKEPIVEKVLNNKAFVATGILPSSSNAYNPEMKGYSYDVERAKQLLKEAGLENGFEFEVLTTSTTAKWMEAMNTYLNPIGINGKIVQLQGGALLEQARTGDYQAVIFSTGGDADGLSFLMSRFHSKNHGRPGNVTLYTNPQVDALLDQAAKTIDTAERIKLVQEAEKIIVDETPWFIFNYNKAVAITQPWVHGIQPVPTDIDFQDLTKVWLSPKK